MGRDDPIGARLRSFPTVIRTVSPSCRCRAASASTSSVPHRFGRQAEAVSPSCRCRVASLSPPGSSGRSDPWATQPQLPLWSRIGGHLLGSGCGWLSGGVSPSCRCGVALVGTSFGVCLVVINGVSPSCRCRVALVGLLGRMGVGCRVGQPQLRLSSRIGGHLLGINRFGSRAEQVSPSCRCPDACVSPPPEGLVGPSSARGADPGPAAGSVCKHSRDTPFAGHGRCEEAYRDAAAPYG